MTSDPHDDNDPREHIQKLRDATVLLEAALHDSEVTLSHVHIEPLCDSPPPGSSDSSDSSVSPASELDSDDSPATTPSPRRRTRQSVWTWLLRRLLAMD